MIRYACYIAAAMLLTACAGASAAAVAAGTSASVPIVIGLLNSWLESGILTEEQHREALAIFQQMGSSFQSIMELIRIWGGDLNQIQEQVKDQALQIQEAQRSAEDTSLTREIAIGGGLVVAGEIRARRLQSQVRQQVNQERDMRRAARGEETD